MPHGHCYLWHPGILWTNLISDLVIAFSYFSIPFALIYIVKKREDTDFKGVFFLFAGFILFCGITHILSIFTIWHGIYGTQGIVKAITAIISLLTAITLFKNIDSIKSIPTIKQLESAVVKASEEKFKRHDLELKQKSDTLFKVTTELIPTGLLVIDSDKKIKLVNKALVKMFGYDTNELEGQSLNILLVDSIAPLHNKLVNGYLKNPKQKHAMAAGRFVNGKMKSGEIISIQISLSSHDIQGEKLTFASITNIEKIMENKSIESSSYNRLRRAISATKMGIWEWDLKTDQVWYSSKFLTLIGEKEDAIPQLKLWQEHVHPDDKKHLKQALKNHLQNKSKYDVIYRGISESGEYEWMRARGDTLFSENNNPILMSGTLTNINEKKKLEQQLANKTKFLNEVLEKSLTGLYIFNLESLANTYINPEYTRLTGYTLEDLSEIQKDKGLTTLFHPEDNHLIAHHLHELTKEKSLSEAGIEYRFRHKKGHWIWCYSRDSIYSYDDKGAPKEMLGTFFDITELKNREQEIKTLALDFLTTFEQAAVGIAHVSLDGRFLKINNKLSEILGYSKVEMLNMSFQEITHKKDLETNNQYLQQIISGKISQYVTEKRYKTKSQKYIWANLTVAAVKNPKGENSHFVAVIEDISHKKKIELQLAESNAALERFAYSASHDLQEPLRKISAFAGSLQSSLEPYLEEGDAKFQLERIADASRRMGEMIDQLLELSRYSRNKAQKSKHLLSKIIAQVTDDLSTIIKQKEVEIKLINDGEIFIEEHSFQQVLRNLILNSINYKEITRPLIITIKCKITYTTSEITVSDNGIGFDKTNNKKIFEPFRRLVGKDLPGYGMGLAICRQIILAHDGKILAIGKKNIGTDIIIKIPNGD
ncbi:PAS domain S-box protein [Aliikangiella sp. IMCC44359]|uniref:PAS domain S-box protein n=1 Tax=Aliikangiella sp. IMCC44359 TaxID=3459125 RepID=UPI00403AC438